MNSPADSQSDREIVLTRMLHAPRALVWQAWTDPKHVVQWWGPRGFTTTTKRHDFRVGGYWEHVMRGPDGTDYPNKSKFLEIVPLERITYRHGGGSDDLDDDRRGVTFVATWTFEEIAPDQTRLTGRMVFPSAETRDRVARDYGAVEGGRQTLERLSEFLPTLQGEPFVIAREFDAPRDLVWKVWTEVEHFARWFGPKGIPVTFAKFDLRPGGMNHYSMRTPDGKVMWGRALYRIVTPPERIVWINSFSDADAGVTRHPFSKDPWPLQLLTDITFVERHGRTTVTVLWLPYEATAEEWKTFNAARPGMQGGWGGTFDQLQAYLPTLK